MYIHVWETTVIDKGPSGLTSCPALSLNSRSRSRFQLDHDGVLQIRYTRFDLTIPKEQEPEFLHCALHNYVVSSVLPIPFVGLYTLLGPCSPPLCRQ